MFKRLLCAALLSLSLAGCAGFTTLTDDLNKRQIKSCVWGMGSYGPFFGVQLMSATGGATLAECHDLHKE